MQNFNLFVRIILQFSNSSLAVLVAVFFGISTVTPVYAIAVIPSDYMVAGTVGDTWDYENPDSTQFTWTLSEVTAGPNAGFLERGNNDSGMVYDLKNNVLTIHELNKAPIDPTWGFVFSEIEIGQVVTLNDDLVNPSMYLFWRRPSITVPAGTFNDVLALVWLDANFSANFANTSLGLDPLITAGVTDIDYFARGIGQVAFLGIDALTGNSDGSGFQLISTSVIACGTTLTSDTTLDSDMICPTSAITFNGAGSNNVILDCAGFSISTTDGIAISARSVSGITIKNCSISASGRSARGIHLSSGTTSSLVSNNTISVSGLYSRAVEIDRGSNLNQITGNTFNTTGGSSSLRIRFADNNIVTDNTIEADVSSAIRISSASNNQVTGNTLISPKGWIYHSKFGLQNGGLGIDNAGTIYAVENNHGSSAGFGTATAFFLINPVTGVANSVIQLLEGGIDVGFGFDALEIMPLPDGRVMALTGSGGGTSPLYEINPSTGVVTAITLNLPVLQGKLNGLEATSITNLLATTNAGELVNINPDTGDATLIGTSGIGWTDLAIHPTSGKAYALSRRRDEFSGTSHLYEIDISNGQIIIEIDDTGQSDFSSIDFALDGTLYGSTGQSGLVVVDTTTGLGTVIGGFGPDPLEPLSQNNTMENNVMQATEGSINFPGSITLPSIDETDISTARVKISSNEAMVDSTALPFLDAPARITLTGLSGTEKRLLVDENDDGTFERCLSPRCTLVSFTGGTLVFDVSGFTTYSSINGGPPSAVALVSPADGATGLGGSVDFSWKISNGNNLVYQFFLCEDSGFVGCTPTIVASAARTIQYAGAVGLLPLVLFGTVLGGIGLRRRKWLTMAIVSLAMVGLISNCGGGGGATSALTDEMSHTESGLKPSTTYFWKVSVSDGIDTTESAVRSFTTQ